MIDILVRPTELRDCAEQFHSSSEKIDLALKAIDSHIKALRGVNFLGNRASALQSHYLSKRDALQRAKELILHFAADLETAANAFEQADKGKLESNSAASYSDSRRDQKDSPKSVKELVEDIDNLLRPIDKMSEYAPKQFDNTLDEIGRLLNVITGHRGNIKLMSELGDLLKGTAKAVGAISNLAALHDFSEYFSGKMTNKEVADVAIKAIVWIPVINEKISAWLTDNMVDPDGTWRGFVTKVE